MKRLLFLIAVISLGCSTEQKQVQFPVEIVATVPDAPTEEGWTVTLDSAVASVGPVRFFPGHVLLTERIKRWMWMPFGGVAQAHPGHYIPGEALGEVLDRRGPVGALGDHDEVDGVTAVGVVSRPAPPPLMAMGVGRHRH